MSEWLSVARAEDVLEDRPHHVSSGGVDAVLVRSDGQVRAFQGLCPHEGALLGEGEIVDGTLVCRNHRWCFDIHTGRRVGGPQCLQEYPLRVVDGRIELDLSSAVRTLDSTGARRRDDLPGPRPWPIVGTSLKVRIDRFHLDLEDWCREYGSVYRLAFGPIPVTVAAEATIIADALRQRPDAFTRFETVRPVFEELGIMGVFSEEGEPWRPQRRLVMGALNPRRVKSFFPMLQAVTKRLQRRWEEAAEQGRSIDIQDDFMRFTVDVTTNLAFREETDTVGGASSTLLDNIGPVFPMLAKRLNAVFPLWRFLKLPADRKVDRSLAEVRSWLSELIEGTRAELESDPERAANPTTFLEAMLMARDADGEPFPDELIFGNCIQILLAGEDTTANTLSWAVHLLLDSPEATQALRKDVDSVLGDRAYADSMELAGELGQVEHVANETMRLKPVAPLLLLTAARDTVVGDLAVERGTGLCLLTRMPALDPERVPEPQRFDPSRWEDATMLSSMQRSGVFVPFGSGPRICPGRSLALLEIRLVLSMLFRNFEIERVGRSEDVREIFGFTVSPRGLRVRLHRRS